MDVSMDDESEVIALGGMSIEPCEHHGRAIDGNIGGPRDACSTLIDRLCVER